MTSLERRAVRKGSTKTLQFIMLQTYLTSNIILPVPSGVTSAAQCVTPWLSGTTPISHWLRSVSCHDCLVQLLYLIKGADSCCLDFSCQCSLQCILAVVLFSFYLLISNTEFPLKFCLFLFITWPTYVHLLFWLNCWLD